MMSVSSPVQERMGRTCGRAKALVVACLTVAALLLVGCTGSTGGGTYDNAASLSANRSAVDLAFDGGAPVDVAPDLHDLDRQELLSGEAARHLGAARLLREVGVIGFLESYVVNIPAGVVFLPNFELQAATSGSELAYGDAGGEARVVRDFERRVLIMARNLMGSWGQEQQWPIDEPDELHDAFYEVLEQCGRDSPWPDVKLADRVGYLAGDVLSLSPEAGISQYEYRELLHMCGRYAATYPTLDPKTRDELLAPQRAYFVKEVLDRLDNELPVVEIPARYQAEVDGLRRSGW